MFGCNSQKTQEKVNNYTLLKIKIYAFSRIIRNMEIYHYYKTFLTRLCANLKKK